MANQTSAKRIQINKANTTMVAVVAISAFIVAFSFVASRALWIRRSYQNRVIAAKEQAADQLAANIAAADELKTAYQAFVSTPENVIGGSSSGTGERDGDNAKIILDALPSKYDFPALATSMENILKNKNYKIENISGSDDEIAQAAAEGLDSVPVEMPFEISATGDFKSIEDLMSILQRSIRPIRVQTVELTGNNSELTATVNAVTYYQPEKTLNIKTKVVK
ncbi:type 4a pilus biogenesis protein PilO [Candidatus Saccharibacteria bacterium]|nr:type 4a pilus biogenesis protein PilO [Candidatus Saccharibacteria bacterium]MCA9337290.1 type 4a pilus biogenesis protein PilO [Candidatus Saccharibacteria bacterium]